MPMMRWVWCLLLLSWSIVHASLSCATTPWTPYYLNGKCVECIHHCDCSDLGDYCSKEGMMTDKKKTNISLYAIGVCLSTEHIIKGDTCIYPSNYISSPVDDKFFCGVYDTASKKIILLGKYNEKWICH